MVLKLFLYASRLLLAKELSHQEEPGEGGCMGVGDGDTDHPGSGWGGEDCRAEPGGFRGCPGLLFMGGADRVGDRDLTPAVLTCSLTKDQYLQQSTKNPLLN